MIVVKITLILIAISIAFAVGIGLGFAGSHFLFVLPTAENFQSYIDTLVDKQDEARQEQYHRGIFDMCVVFLYATQRPGDCNQMVAGAHSGGWYGMGSDRFVWPVEETGTD